MSGIDPTQRLIAQIRAALATRTDKQRGSSTDTAKSATSRADNGSSSEQLSQDIRVAVRGINLDVEDGLPRGRRAFVEVVLLDEFGVSLANDPRFPQIVDRVAAAIGGEEELREALDSLLQQFAAT